MLACLEPVTGSKRQPRPRRVEWARLTQQRPAKGALLDWILVFDGVRPSDNALSEHGVSNFNEPGDICSFDVIDETIMLCAEMHAGIVN